MHDATIADKPALTLTPLQRRVAEEWAAGKTRREIAKLLSVTEGAIKKHLSRARKRALAQRPALQRYAEALARPDKPVRVRSFSLLATEQV